jgi:sulfite exporter TauE/SafE/copper chaperone CopZ
MEGAVKTERLRVGGMTCVHCQNKIERTLRNTGGIVSAEVDYNTGAALVSYNTNTITVREIVSIIEKLDYRVLSNKRGGGALPLGRALGFLAIIAVLFLLIRKLGPGVFFTAFPLAEAGMGYGMLFVIGLVTSVHCVAMCGGINLSQCLPGAGGGAAIRPSLLYNLGRLLSYTAVGIIVGALGRAISFSGAMKGIVQITAGVFMVIMGLAMLDIFPALRRLSPRMPKIFARRIEEERDSVLRRGQRNSALYVGLLTGLMPCGPLQAMQLYALSAGSPTAGGLSMLIFSLGTVPLMFGFGALSSLLSKKFTRAVMSAGAALVAVLGLVMFSNGWSLSGFSTPADLLRPPQLAEKAGGTGAELVLEDGFQLVNTTLLPGQYEPIVVMAGIPVRWTIDAPRGSINGCNNRMIVREYGIELRFVEGANVIEFTPDKPGVFRYSCWMGMIRSSITALESGADMAAFEAAVPAAEDDYWDDAYYEEEFGDMAEWGEEDMEDFWKLFAEEFPEESTGNNAD